MTEEFLTYGMVGGGAGAFSGAVHRKAASFDGKARLVAGCFSRSLENTLATGARFGLESDRLYATALEMAEAEAVRPDKLDFVAIVTPNYAHYEAAKAFLESGINVVCEKPLCFTVREAETLEQLAKAKGLLFCVTYTYSGYPMVKQAREIVRQGDLGEIRMVMGEYPGEWLAAPPAKKGNPKAVWRIDPQLTGASNCVGDIGSHLEHLVAYITGLKIKRLCANLDLFGPDQALDNNAAIMVKYCNGASGVYWCSQVAIGYHNALKVRIFGSEGSLEWEQEHPDHLRVTRRCGPPQIYSRGCGYLYPSAMRFSRIPAGHPEGYYEAFANIYTAFCDALLQRKVGRRPESAELDFPDVEAGLDGVKFIQRCVQSSKLGGLWVELESEE